MTTPSEWDRSPHIPEDVEREPDGIPHRVVGLTAVICILLALLTAILFVTRAASGIVIMLALVAIPVVVIMLERWAARGRDREHPSR